MQHPQNSSYSPVRDFIQIVNSLTWNVSTHNESTFKAFMEAIKRSISQPKAFFEVAQRTYRVTKLDWEKLLQTWNRALQQSKIPSNGAGASGAPNRPQLNSSSNGSRHQYPPPAKGSTNHPNGRRADNPGNGKHHGGTKHSHPGFNNGQRRAASLVNYYS